MRELIQQADDLFRVRELPRKRMDFKYSDITGTAALVISLFNLLYLMRSRRIKLHVNVRPGSIGELVKIEVTNLSHFPVTVVDVGIINGAGDRQAVAEFANAAMPSNLPCELVARGIKTFTMNATTYMAGAKESVRGGYVRIAGGKEFVVLKKGHRGIFGECLFK